MSKLRADWVGGHRVRLLENGEAYFPAVFDAIRQARVEVLIETFIIFEDKVGWALHRELIAAAQRGVRVDLMVDGFGSADLTPAFIEPLVGAGVRLRSFDPGWRLFGQRLNIWRRMHRKLVVVDALRAFVGGINFSADHLADFGPMAKQDYAVELEGGIVAVIRHFAVGVIGKDAFATRPLPGDAPAARWPQPEPLADETRRALFVRRDNFRHRNDIEWHYRAALRTARQRVVIANAYFFPGARLLRDMSRAARRGVDVRLILQGEPDIPIVRSAASMLYGHLQRDGVKIHEYCKRPLHGKVALVDDTWATVGSSNLDPLSLSLNLEANVILLDAGFNAELHANLQRLIDEECELAKTPPKPRWEWWHRLRSLALFHFLRRFPVWASHLPSHRPKLVLPACDAGQSAAGVPQAPVDGLATR